MSIVILLLRQVLRSPYEGHYDSEHLVIEKFGADFCDQIGSLIEGRQYCARVDGGVRRQYVHRPG